MTKTIFSSKPKLFFSWLIIFFFSFSLFLPNLARGNEVTPEPPEHPDYESELTKGTVILERGNLIGIILEGIRALLAFTGATALVMIIFAGQKWMMAGGNEENIKKAKAMLKNALIGLCISILAYTLATWAITSLHGGILPPILFFL